MPTPGVYVNADLYWYHRDANMSETGSWDAVKIPAQEISSSNHYYATFRIPFAALPSNITVMGTPTLNARLANGSSDWWEWRGTYNGGSNYYDLWGTSYFYLGATYGSGWKSIGLPNADAQAMADAHGYYAFWVNAQFADDASLMTNKSGGTDPAFLAINYGFIPPGRSYTPAPRQFTLTWGSSDYADSYNIYDASDTYIGNTTGTSYTIYNQSYTGRTFYIRAVYDMGLTAPGSVVAYPTDPSTYGPTVPTGVVGNTPVHKKIQATPPAAIYGSSSFDWEVRTASGGGGSAVATATGVSGTQTFNLMTQAAGTYYVRCRARWSDGEVSGWSATVSVNITQPTVSVLTATSTLPRQINASWNATPSASSYNVSIDGGAPVNQAGTTKNFTNIHSGSHSILVTPVYTNGYTGAVTSGSVTGEATLPTPTAPSAVGDQDAAGAGVKRKIKVTGPLTHPNDFYSANRWEFQRDGNIATLISPAAGVQTSEFVAVPSGTHTVQVRAVWTDGDVSAWSPASSSVATTTPPPTSVTSRQKSAPPLATTSLIGSGSLTVGSYFVAVSVAAGGNRDVQTVNGLSRAVNESTNSALQDNAIVVNGTQNIRVTKPASCTGSDTWNVYVGTSRNKLKRVAADLSSGTATSDVSGAWSEPASNEAKTGQVDLSWVAPTGVGDSPTTYIVERAPSVPSNSPTGTPGSWTNVTSTNGGLYGSSLNFYNDRVDSKYWFYRVIAVYSNEQAAATEIAVLV